MISTVSVGVDHIDVDYAQSRNIAIGHTPGVLTDSTADLAIGLMLAVGVTLFCEGQQTCVEHDPKKGKRINWITESIARTASVVKLHESLNILGKLFQNSIRGEAMSEGIQGQQWGRGLWPLRVDGRGGLF